MAHECSECTFVNSAESIHVDPKIRWELTEKPVYIGKFTMPDWVGHARFYAFVCPECLCLTVDYPHGYTDGGRLYFNRDHYSNCEGGGEGDILPINSAKIYKAEGFKKPRPFGGFFRLLLLHPFRFPITISVLLVIIFLIAWGLSC